MARIVTDFIEENYLVRPDKVLFSDSNSSVTVSEFRNTSLKIANQIINTGLFRKPVALYMDKSVEQLETFMGVAYSGNFYTPMDTAMPVERAINIFNVLEPKLVIAQKKYKDLMEGIGPNIPIIYFEDICEIEIDEKNVYQVQYKIIDSDPLYVLFTSGSTGIPKGVVVSHKSVVSYANWVVRTFKIDEKTVFGNQTPFYFSMSVLDIFATLKSGATMYIIPKILFSFPVKLMEYIIEKKINTIYWVPSALCLVANLKALGIRDISCLEKVMFAGEVMPTKQLNMWMNALPNTLFANLFGPTEATDISNYYIVDRKLSDDEPVPIGKACNNVDILILDENDILVEENGIMGELCIRGSILAYGYYNNIEKTKESFVQNPLNLFYPETIYRTGDLVHINEYGELIYDGRKDFQIKHMGHRIELGEIETAVSSINDIDANFCNYDVNNKEIVLFYCGRLDKESVYDEIKNKIPSYMVPTKIIKLNRMLLNGNGKIDRKNIFRRYIEGDLNGK